MGNVLKIKDGNGNWIGINSIMGKDGKSAYEQAKEGGYTGTEEEFNAALNGLTASGFVFPKIATGSYVGAGGEDVKLTFDFAPKVVFVSRDANSYDYNGQTYVSGGTAITLLYGMSNAAVYRSDEIDYRFHFIEWGDNFVSWAAPDSDHAANGTGKTYYYVAIG